MTDRPYIGVGVLLWQERHLLLGKRICADGDSCWQFPGGHLEGDESVIECASREVLEETGLNISDPVHLAVTDRSFRVGQDRYITLFVSCDYVSGDPVLVEPDKCECWRWFDYQKLPQPLFEPVEILLSQYHDLYALKQTLSVAAVPFEENLNT